MIKKNINTNQKSFFFADNSNKSLQQINKSKLMITEDRVYLLFFVFFCLISIFTIKILLLSLGKINYEKNSIYLNSKFEIFLRVWCMVMYGVWCITVTGILKYCKAENICFHAQWS